MLPAVPYGRQRVIVSLGEVEVTVRKAARGAGWPWGFAEELGVSARLLTATTLPGAAWAAALLQGDDIRHCPIRFAAHSCDLNTLPTQPTSLAQAVLAVPLLARHFCKPGESLSCHWGGVELEIDADGYARICAGTIETVPAITSLAVHCAPQRLQQHKPQSSGVTVADTDWHTLDSFAANSYVPASDQSRQGAGPAD